MIVREPGHAMSSAAWKGGVSGISWVCAWDGSAKERIPLHV